VATSPFATARPAMRWSGTLFVQVRCRRGPSEAESDQQRGIGEIDTSAIDLSHARDRGSAPQPTEHSAAEINRTVMLSPLAPLEDGLTAEHPRSNATSTITNVVSHTHMDAQVGGHRHAWITTNIMRIQRLKSLQLCH
jgi:hypothetical protein